MGGDFFNATAVAQRVFQIFTHDAGALDIKSAFLLDDVQFLNRRRQGFGHGTCGAANGDGRVAVSALRHGGSGLVSFKLQGFKLEFLQAQFGGQL